MQGWFDAFRTDGGPTLYAYSNRTSVTGDVPTITICLVFLTIYVAFLLIFPGVRQEKFSTFCTVSLSLLTGITICLCIYGSDWEIAGGEITTFYRSFSSQRIKAHIGVRVGLDHANVTYKIVPMENRSIDIAYNERFYWITPEDMKRSFKEGLERGLPFPVLTVAEYLSLDKEGFSWGRDYRHAGYYTGVLLCSAFAAWVLANILLLNVPRYGAYMLMCTGSLMGGACLAFYLLKPLMPLKLRFEDTIIMFQPGWCFWMTLVVGSIVGISGLIISIMDWIQPHTFSTILEVDFDTPYDRHIIIQHNEEIKKNRWIPKLEEPITAGLHAGSRLLRRLSKRGKPQEVDTNPGVDNPGFEMETPKSPWKNHLIGRTDSKKSNKSVNFKASQKSNVFLEIPDGQTKEEQPVKVFNRSDSKQSNTSTASAKLVNEIDVRPEITRLKRQDSCQSCSSSSSLGLGLLSRGSSIGKHSEENLHQPAARMNSANIIVFHRTDSRGQLQRLSGEVVEIQTDDRDNW